MLVAGGAVMAGLGVATKKAMDFQTQMANVSTMLDKNSMKYMPEFSKGIKDLSEKFGESTKTLSDGLYNILSASVAPAKALDVLKVAVKSASAGLTDTGVAADAITTILNSYGMSADKAGEVSDKLFAIVKRGKTTYAQLAPAIGRVASTASKAGLSFDDLGAAIATLTRAGISTDEAMTSINGILRAFLKPTKDAQKEASKFGLALNTATLKSLGLTGVLKKLKNATAEQLAAIFPDIRGLKGISAALGDTTGFMKDYQLMTHSAGLTQEAFAKQSNTLEFQTKQLREELNNVAVSIGTALIPIVKTFIDTSIKPLLDWFNKLPNPVKENIAKFVLLSGTILLVGGSIVKLINNIREIVPAIKTTFKVISTMVSTNPMLLLLAGIATALFLLYEAWKNDWGGIREKTKAVWNKIRPIFEAIKKIFLVLVGLVKAYIDIYIAMWQKVQPIFHELGGAFKWIGKVVADVFGIIGGWFDKLIGWILNAIDKVEKLLNKLSSVFKHQGKAQENAVNGEGGIFDLSGIPGHAEGGYFTTPHLALVAEKEPELIVPQSKLKDFGTTTITLNINVGTWLGDEQGIQNLASKITEYIDRALGERQLRGNYYFEGVAK